jgi:hypothetical protein
MNQAFVGHQLDVVARPDAGTRVAKYVFDTCWPGGGTDRTIQAARAWVDDWRPERVAIDLTGCGCATGRCRICN